MSAYELVHSPNGQRTVQLVRRDTPDVPADSQMAHGGQRTNAAPDAGHPRDAVQPVGRFVETTSSPSIEGNSLYEIRMNMMKQVEGAPVHGFEDGHEDVLCQNAPRPECRNRWRPRSVVDRMRQGCVV